MAYIYGCDLSVFQGPVDFDLLKSSASFAITKATEGIGFVDRTFTTNWSGSAALAIRGAYHFARPDLGNSATDEANYFLNIVGDLEPGDLLALDYEANWDGDVVGWCKQFLDTVFDRTGVAPFVYINLSLVRSHDWSPVIDSGYPLWLADYDGSTLPVDTPWPVLAIKQYTSGGALAGVPARVDLNVFYGGLAQLAKYGVKGTATLATPIYCGETATVITIKVGEVSVAEGIWDWGNGPRAVPFKVYATAPGAWPVIFYPPADPDNDPTEVVNAQPALFIVAATK